jgi:P27 family predicted phage terminase small subunit
MKAVPNSSPKPPTHLSAAGKALWSSIVSEAPFIFQSHHYETLQILCTALDRAADARKVLAPEGVTVTGQRGTVAHPAAAIERESQRTALAAMRALNLDADAAKPGLKVAGGVFR